MRSLINNSFGMKVIYEISEKFRAGLLEKAGYVLCSPLCLLILNLILSGFQFTVIITVELIVSAVLFYLGLRVLWQGYLALSKVDEQIRKCYDHDIG